MKRRRVQQNMYVNSGTCKLLETHSLILSCYVKSSGCGFCDCKVSGTRSLEMSACSEGYGCEILETQTIQTSIAARVHVFDKPWMRISIYVNCLANHVHTMTVCAQDPGCEF